MINLFEMLLSFIVDGVPERVIKPARNHWLSAGNLFLAFGVAVER